jgi:uncharacterized delta-60 repeat protein
MTVRFIGLIATALAAAPLIGGAAVGDVDTTFGDAGVSLFAPLDIDLSSPSGPLVQHDGRIVVCGQGISADGLQYTGVITRMTPDGAPDPDFGEGGRADLGDYLGVSACPGFALADNDAIIAAGPEIVSSGGSAADSGSRVMRFDADGHPDHAFGDDGVAHVNVLPGRGDGFLMPMALQHDGAIVFASPDEPNAFAVARLLPDGSEDAQFGDGGRVSVEFAHTTDLAPDVTHVAIDGAGRIVVAGSLLDPVTTISNFAVVRLLPDGTPDASFGNGGRVTFGFDAPYIYSYPMTVLVQRDGRIVLAGTGGNTWDTGTPNYNVAVARLREDGSLDPAFGVGGKAFIAVDDVPNGVDMALSGLILRDGRILLAGRADQLYVAGAMLLQLNPDGTRDAGFGDRGVRTYSLVPGIQNAQIITGIATQGPDFIIVGQSSNNSNEVTAFAARVEGTSLPGHSHHRRLPRLPDKR